MPTTRFTTRVVRSGVLALGLVACNQDSLLTAPTPDVILPKDIQGASVLPAAYASALGDFQVAYAGGYGSGLDNNEGINQISGLLSDELINTETFNTRIEVDRRATNSINGSTLQTFQDLQRSRASADLIASRFRQYLPGDARGATVQALAAYEYVLLAENYCNGVPTSYVDDAGVFKYGPAQTGTALLNTAVAKFDSSLATSPSDLARIGRGRALLDLGRFTDAAAAVATVASSYNYSVEHSENTGRENNAAYTFNFLEGRFGVGNREGTNGLPYVDLNDPRAPVADYGPGFDGITEEFVSGKYYSRTAPTQLATGSEARLIEAEAALQAGNTTLFLSKLNAARANATTYSDQYNASFTALGGPVPNTLAPLTVADLGTAAQNRDLLFRERALTLFLTSHRVGDLRRLVYQYGLNSEQVFPTGTYEKTQTAYGTAVNLPIPQEEANNPNFKPAACINRSADIK